ncbi:MAG: TrmB family transcriptional regulator [Promethearchaeota archaeon]
MKKYKMPKIKPEIRLALKNLGFTDYFSNLYITLLKSGEMNAHELSEITGVPYSRIYEILNDMVGRLIITKIEGRPSTFIANEPTDVFTLLKRRKEQVFTENINNALPFLKELFGEKRPPKQVTFTLLEGDKASRDHLRNLINATSYKLLAAIRDVSEVYPIIKNNLEFLKTKGVEVQIIIESRYKGEEFMSVLQKHCSINFVEDIYQTLFISDDNAAFQGARGYFRIDNPQKDGYSIFSSKDMKYIMYLKQIFNNIWKMGTNNH